MSVRHLVLGGARSGKSRHALSVCSDMAGPHAFIATAQAHDDEMEDRISRHRAERDGRWQTIEEPLHPERAIASLQDGVILVDCCTLWLSNVMLAERDMDAAVDALCESVRGARANIVLVSNEVGGGIVPDTALGRRFRDEQGRLNQRLAALCDRVELVVAGLPLRLKG